MHPEYFLRVLSKKAEDDDWNGRDEQKKRQLWSGRVDFSGEHSGGAKQADFDVFPEIRDDSAQGTDVNGDVDCLSLIRDSREIWQ